VQKTRFAIQKKKMNTGEIKRDKDGTMKVSTSYNLLGTPGRKV